MPSPRKKSAQHPKSAAETEGFPGSRGDRYCRLIHRFYEPLKLLEVLGSSTRGHHTPIPHEPGTPEFVSRRFLDHLSYLCDYDKGGPTTTAIGLEECDDCFRYWVASNKASQKILDFLASVLASLKQLFRTSLQRENPEKEKFLEMCIDFAKPRINKETKFLKTSITVCHSILLKDSSPEAHSLLQWLEMFKDKTHLALCQLAFDHRKDPAMTFITDRSKTTDETSPNDATCSSFAALRHHIGRLAHHIRAVKEVIDDSKGLKRQFDEYEVRLVPKVESIDPPKADSKTTPEGIIKRMSTKDGAPLPDDVSRALKAMSEKMPLHDKILEKYADVNFKPAVHAEIQVLEHFYRQRLAFSNKGLYIGCSKPACYLCHLYIQHHPLHCIVPQSHKKIYFNWGPPRLADGVNDDQYITQRDILNSMLRSIRKEVFDQICGKVKGFGWHPDSITNITQNTRPVLGENSMKLTVEALEKLNIGNTHETWSSVANAGTERAPSRSGSYTSSKDDTVVQAHFHDQITSSDDESDSDGGAALTG